MKVTAIFSHSNQNISGSPAVYEARSVVSHSTGIRFDDTQLCNIGQRSHNRESNSQPIEKNNIVIFPNPNSGDLWISGAEGELTVRITNQFGQVFVRETVTNNHLSLRTLPQGIYVVQIFSPDQQLLTIQKIQKVD